MLTKVLFILAGLAGVVTGSAQSADAPKTLGDCKDAKDQDRLKCYDKVAHYEKPSAPPPAKAPPQTVTVKLLQTTDYNTEATDISSIQPAQINLQRSGGTDGSSIKAGLIGLFRTPANLPELFVAAGWNRDTTAKIPKDQRTLGVGAMGTMYRSSADTDLALFGTARIDHRYDIFGTTNGTSARLNVDVIRNKWLDGSNFLDIMPQLGYLDTWHENGDSELGHWRSVYVGFKSSKGLEQVSNKLKVNLDYGRFMDASVPEGNTKRSVNNGTLSLTYDLSDNAKNNTAKNNTADSNTKSPAWQPILSLSREFGTDVVNGGTPTNKTVLGFGLKYQ